jgi:hypothetical protein
MHMELPENMRKMRQVLCAAWSAKRSSSPWSAVPKNLWIRLAHCW